MMLPVRTLFAHQWLTMPQYILRAYPTEVGDKMEWLVNWINPGIIFIGVPLLTAMTRRANVYTMMIVGSLVSAVPTFLLCTGPNLNVLIVYFVVFSIGEALWSARFLEYASELAPPGRVAQYMGLAQIPWLLAKGTTGLYSGFLLASILPARHAARATAHRHAVVHLRLHRHEHAHRPVACTQVGHERAARHGREVEGPRLPDAPQFCVHYWPFCT